MTEITGGSAVPPTSPVESFPAARFTIIGQINVVADLVVGEAFEHTIPDATGTWAVRWIDMDAISEIHRDLDAAGKDADDERHCQQLQAYLVESDPDELLESLKPECVLPIHAAWFRIGDGSLQPFFREHTAMNPLFDGVEGLIGGAGAAVYLGGDGRAEVHVARGEFGAELIHVNLI